MRVRGVCAVLLGVALAGCASAPPAQAPARQAPVIPLDQRVAWILRLEAQRWLADPADARADLRVLVADTDAGVRRRAALAVGRVGLPEGVDVVLPLLADADPAVRAQAAFALGLLGRPSAEGALRTALTDADVTVRGRAAEALGLIATQIGGPRDPWVTPANAVAAAFKGCGPLLAPIAPDDEAPQSAEVEACRLALFALVRLRHYDALAAVALDDRSQPVSRWWPVAWALQRSGDERARPALETLARSAGVYTTALAIRGLAGQPAVWPLARRFALDAAADARVRVAAIRALGRPDAPEGVTTLLEVLAARELPVTVTLEVIEALGATRDARAFEVLVDRFTDRHPVVRAAAVTAAARVDPDAFLIVVSSLPPDREWSVRAALATAYGGLEPDRVRTALIEASEDQDQRVRGPALTALVRVGAPDLSTRLLEALKAPDFALRSTAAGLIGRQKLDGAVAALTAAYERGLSDAAFDARAAAVAAAHAIGGPEAEALVRRALEDRDWAVRVRAAQLLGGDAQAARPAPLRHPVDFFESAALLHPEFSPVALIETRLGVIEIELNVVEAPLTSRNFIDLARTGFFNGLRIHRLVPNFVVQTGDPRGDGVGGPGYAIVDELSPLPYTRGTVGMALSWADTGGSQFFITHSPQPHLDGRYTVFGRVVRGMDVVDRLSLGDTIDRIRIWDGVTLK